MSDKKGQYVSRAGDKLAAAMDEFGIIPAGWVCADFGANVGGFTDCMLQRGAKKVYAIDTGYGDLAWTLRKDERVVVMERTNVLHCDVVEAVDMVVIDTAWTPQKLSVPAASKWLKSGGRIISLLKPHFELTKIVGKKKYKLLDDADYKLVIDTITQQLTDAGLPPKNIIPSPIKGKGGNTEYLILIET